MNSTNQTNNITWFINDLISFHYLPYTILNTTGILVGVFGNILILSAILLTKQLQNTANILIFHLSFAHLFVAGFIYSTALICIILIYYILKLIFNCFITLKEFYMETNTLKIMIFFAN
jgi:hypothetical protein